MSDDDKLKLRPATQEEIEQSLSFALRYDGRKRVRHADDAMARITAERLVAASRALRVRHPQETWGHGTVDERAQASQRRLGAGDMPDYVELQVTSNYSFLRGASHIEELFVQAKALGLPAIAITDHNTLAGIARGHARAEEVGIRPDRRLPRSTTRRSAAARLSDRSCSLCPVVPAADAGQGADG